MIVCKPSRFFHHLSRPVLAALLVVGPLATTAAAAEVLKTSPPGSRTDREGVALPAEALARVGSARLRHGGWLQSLEYSPDGSLLASSGSDSVRLWSARTGRLVREIAMDGSQAARAMHGLPGGKAPHVHFSPDGAAVVVFDGRACRWLDVRTGKETQHSEIQLPNSLSIACLAPGCEAIAVTGLSAKEGLVAYDLPSGRGRFRKTFTDTLTRTVAFSPDGRRLAVCDSDPAKKEGRSYRVRLFDAATGVPLAKFTTEHRVDSLAFSPDNQKLALQDRFGSVEVRDGKDGKKVLRRIPLQLFSSGAVSFGADGASVIVGEGFDASQIDLATGRAIHRFHTGGSCSDFALTPDGNGLAVGTADGRISQWDLSTGERRAPSVDAVGVRESMRFTAGGRVLELWADGLSAVDWQTGREVRRVEVPLRETGRGQASWAGRGHAIAADWSCVAGANAKGQLVVWDAVAGKELCTVGTRQDDLEKALAFSPDGKILYTDSLNGVTLWDAEHGTKLDHFQTELGFNGQQVALSLDGRRLAARCRSREPRGDDSIKVWDVATRREVQDLQPPGSLAHVAAIAFSPDGRSLAAVGSSGGAAFGRPGDFHQATIGRLAGFIQVWDVRTGEKTVAHTRLQGSLSSAAFSPDGRLLVTADETDALRVWELATGGERHSFVGHRSTVTNVVLSPDGELLASASADAPVFIWDVGGCFGRAPSSVPITAGESAKLWQALDDADASAAFAAMRELLARPGPAVTLLRDRLRPAAGADEAVIRRLLKEVNSGDFDAREKACAGLEATIDTAEPLVRAALKESRSAETKRRLENVLDAGDAGAPGRRRQVRAVEVAERLGTLEARGLLKAWAGGAKGVLLTREAQAAVARLNGW